jgi:hypothetical protein
MLQNTWEAVSPAPSAVLAIQQAQVDPDLATALTEVTGSIDVEHDVSGNTIQCPDSGYRRSKPMPLVHLSLSMTAIDLKVTLLLPSGQYIRRNGYTGT